MKINLSDAWDCDINAPCSIAEKADGSLTVSAPKSKAWTSATGKITGKHVVIGFNVGPKHQTGIISSDNAYIKWSDGSEWTRHGAVPAQGHLGGGKEIVLKLNSALQSKGTFYTDSNGREMVKRQVSGPSVSVSLALARLTLAGHDAGASATPAVQATLRT